MSYQTRRLLSFLLFILPFSAQAAPSLLFYADTNRDGLLTPDDALGRNFWAPKSGAFLFVNNNDSNRDGLADFADGLVNGDDDLAELTELTLSANAQGLESPSVSFEILSPAAARERVHIFAQTNTDMGFVLVSNAAPLSLPASGKMRLFAEAREFASGSWNGTVQVAANLLDAAGNKRATDTVTLQASPFFLMPNTLPATELFVRERGASNANFIAQILSLLQPLGVKVTVAPPSPRWQDMWMQNTMKFGYSQMPTVGGVKNTTSILAATRGEPLDTYPQSLLSPSLGVFSAGKPRKLQNRDGWADWFGNLDVSPPLPGFPNGRFYYGNSGTATLQPELVALLNAQGVQGPGVELDTSWLLIKHVDEIVSFLPGPGGAPVMLIISPAEGVRMLQEVRKYVPGNSIINRGLDTQTTLDAVLANREFIQHNLNLQAQHLDALQAKLAREFRLAPQQIIRIPGLFNADGSAWTPNLVNSNLINKMLLTSDPRFPTLNGRDFLQDVFRNLVAPTGLQVQFLDDVYYHQAKGNTYCGTIALRQPPEVPFWR